MRATNVCFIQPHLKAIEGNDVATSHPEPLRGKVPDQTHTDNSRRFRDLWIEPANRVQ